MRVCTSWPLLLGLALPGTVLLAGCHHATQYQPEYVARGELTLRYDDGFQIYAGNDMLAESPRYDGLAHYVRCAPRAAHHAEEAESDGSFAIGLGATGVGLGFAGLGGLAGLAFVESDKPVAFALLGSGVAVGLLGVILAAVSRGYKNSANGHAVDALNHYNDAVGSLGGSCDQPRPERPPTPPPAATPPVEPSPTPAATPPVEPPPPPAATPPVAPPPGATGSLNPLRRSPFSASAPG